MRQEESFTTDLQEKRQGFFFDSYALFEIIKGNPNYRKYASCDMATSKLNIFELFHGFLRDKQEELAETAIERYYPYVVDFDDDVIREAARMKLVLNKRNVSMVDCIGYILSIKLGIKFLTGDKEFENLKNVEFVK